MTPEKTRPLSLRVQQLLDRDGLRRVAQVTRIALRNSREDQIFLRASALTFYAVLSIIPLLAIALSVVSALGVREDLASRLVEPLSVGSPEAGAQILALVEKVELGALGTLGAVMLFLTAILGIGTIERSLNALWDVDSPRSWERRFSDYLAVLIVAPILLGVAVSLGTTLQSQAVVGRLLEIPGFAPIYRFGLRQAPIVFLWLGFSFLYWFLPNTRVSVRGALFGGAIAAGLFTGAQILYVASNVVLGNASALFGSFAALPLLLLWIYISWVIVLFGGELAFAFQTQRRGQPASFARELSPATRESLALAVVTRIGRAFRDGEGPVSIDALAAELGFSERNLRRAANELTRANILSASGHGSKPGLQLARPSDQIGLAQIVAAPRGSREPTAAYPADVEGITRVLSQVDQHVAACLEKRTLAELL